MFVKYPNQQFLIQKVPFHVMHALGMPKIPNTVVISYNSAKFYNGFDTSNKDSVSQSHSLVA